MSSSVLLDFPKLNDSNYHQWKTSMKSALQTMAVWRIVTGDRVKPAAGDPELEKYYEAWDKAAGTIKLKVEDVRRLTMKGLRTIPRRFGLYLRLLMSPRNLPCDSTPMPISFTSVNVMMRLSALS